MQSAIQPTVDGVVLKYISSGKKNPPVRGCVQFKSLLFKGQLGRASLVAQWLRIHLPMQGTWV